MALIVRGTFQLVDGGTVEAVENIEQGLLSYETFAEDDEDRTGAILTPSDLSGFKVNAEVMLAGSCYAPKGPTTVVPVRLTVGDWKKELMVYGERRWQAGAGDAAPGDPEPFEKMPLDYAHAFGGAEFAANPVGVGHGDDPRVPNVELVSEPLKYRKHGKTPASFAPINESWPQRAQYVGKNYGGDYRKKRAPFHADDHDWRHYSARPRRSAARGLSARRREVGAAEPASRHARAHHALTGLAAARVREGRDGGDPRGRHVPRHAVLRAGRQHRQTHLARTHRGCGRRPRRCDAHLHREREPR